MRNHTETYLPACAGPRKRVSDFPFGIALYTWLKYMFLVVGLICGCNLWGQQTLSVSPDSLKSQYLYQKAQQAFMEGHFTKALSLARSSIQELETDDSSELESNLFWLMGSSNRSLGVMDSSMKYYLLTLLSRQDKPTASGMDSLHQDIGSLYQDWEAPRKALTHFSIALNLKKDQPDTKKIPALQGMALAFTQLDQPDSAQIIYQRLADIYSALPDSMQLVNTLRAMSQLFLDQAQYAEALEINLRILDLNRQMQTTNQLIITLNNLGFLHKFLNQNDQALNYFSSALSMMKAINYPPEEMVIPLTNIGILYQNLGDYNNSLTYLFQAVEALDSVSRPQVLAQTYNLISIIYLTTGESRSAIYYNQKAIDMAEKHALSPVQEAAYKTRSEIFEQISSFKIALDYFKKHTQIKDSLSQQLSLEQGLYLQRQFFVEQLEKEMSLLSVDREIKALELKKALLESERQEQQVELLLRQQQLQKATIREQQLEAAQRDKELLLAQQLLDAEKKDQEITVLQKDREIQQLALKQRDLEEKEQRNQIQLLQKNQAVQDLKLEEEKLLRQFFLGGLILLGIILLLFIRNNYLRRRAHRLLSKQKGEIENVLSDLKQAQSQLVNSEKMASLGQLTAGIAHEINNPISFISTNAHALKLNFGDLEALISQLHEIKNSASPQKEIKRFHELYEQKQIPMLGQEIDELLDGINRGAIRTKEIVAGLKLFSRSEVGNMVLADVHEVIDSALMLLQNKIKTRIRLHKNYGQIPQIYCLPGKLNQVFMNLFNNAIQAIESADHGETEGELGDIYVHTTLVDGRVKIQIRDNGIGIPPQLQKRIFEPFFTTKRVGEGTGLGLSISYGIIQQHKGIITVSSQEGQGTEFTLLLPMDNQSHKES